MGDGRYYSIAQFVNVVFLTLVIIYVVTVFMMQLYKTSGDQNSRRFLRPTLLILLGLFILFLEEVIVDVSLIHRLDMLWLVTFIMMHILFLLDVIYLNKKSKYGLDNIVVSVLVILAVVFKPDVFISYQPNGIEFENMFFVILGLLILINVYLVFRLYKMNPIRSYLYNHLGLWILPSLVFLIVVMLNSDLTRLVLCLIYASYAFGIYNVALLRTPYRIGMSVFRNIRFMLDDYIYITDKDGNIIYRNKKVRESDFLITCDKVSMDSLDKLFDEKIDIRQAYNKQFIKYFGKDEMYFNLSNSLLKDKNELVGFIITFMDITDLIQMLDQLGEKQDQAVILNRQLSEYKEIVYEFEKERETIKILDEISEKQEKSMHRLKNMVKDLASSQAFESDINDILSRAKEDLKDVRAAVSTYMNE
ncbi:hypothetical protein EZV73_02970 [Acidaminobacter sp. JC074]|uniref:hypothetical protein n=1 Tax=Acidaminobacter sp. JC074 TaxID=2530199 RepID=UPI001F0FDA53|nr:hypothetical protein [Acidaminobacter sp. JC074]MCH4886510.1 hypothetical protein [Acidaminobacter sp. JC074]